MKTYDRIARAVFSTPWAILPEKLEAIRAFLELKCAAGSVDSGELERMRAAHEAAVARSVAMSSGAVQVLPMLGVICHRANMFSDYSGGTSTDKFMGAFRQASADPGIKAIVIDCDSPGGGIDGVPELADEIYKARGKKPVVAVANCLMASAAYWICSQCDEVVVSQSAWIGSIGVYSVVDDYTKMMEDAGIKEYVVKFGAHKAEFVEPVTQDALDYLKTLIDESGNSFVSTVARGRGVKAAVVKSEWGEGRVVTPQQAVRLGMADRIGTIDSVLAKYGVSRSTARAEEPISLTSTDSLHEPVGQEAEKGGEQHADANCACGCEKCRAGDCEDCSNPDCDDPNCEGEHEAKASAKANELELMRLRIDLA